MYKNIRINHGRGESRPNRSETIRYYNKKREKEEGDWRDEGDNKRF